MSDRTKIRKNPGSVTIKAAWIGGICLIVATLIAVIFSGKSDAIKQTAIASGSNAVINQVGTLVATNSGNVVQSVGANNSGNIAQVANSTNVIINQGAENRMLSSLEIEMLSAAIPNSSNFNLLVDYTSDAGGAKARAVQLRGILTANGFDLKPMESVVLMATDCYRVWFYVSTNYPFDATTKRFNIPRESGGNAIAAILSVFGNKYGITADKNLPPSTIRIIVGKSTCD